MTRGPPISVTRCRRRHKCSAWASDEVLEEDPECCSSAAPHCSQSFGEKSEEEATAEDEIPLSTRIPPLPHNRQRRQKSTTDGIPSEEYARERMMTPKILLFRSGVLLLLCTFLQPSSAFTELRCGPVDIRNSPMGFRARFTSVGDPNNQDTFNKSQVDCTVVEGSFTLSFIYKPPTRPEPYKLEDYPRFPYLREITGSLLVFETTGLTDLNWIFPNLRVIGGQTLIQHYSLIIYRNHDLTTMGLNKLSAIRNGGVRIMDNKLLCFTKTIDWKSMIHSVVNDVTIDDAAEWSVTETGQICPAGPCEVDLEEKNCRYVEQKGGRIQSCWGPRACRKACKYDRDEITGEPGPGCDSKGNQCHIECIGGCERADDATKCHACKNFHYKGKCIPKCDDHLYVLLGRRCVTKKQCLSLNPVAKNITVHIKATNGICSDKCPNLYEENPENPKECRMCKGECQITCAGNFTIDTYPKALAIRRCNIIEGSLTVEIRGNSDSGMAGELNNLFASIHTIKGYLHVMRSPPFLTLHMFRNLRKIEGNQLYKDKYALTVIENQNLRKLFDESLNLTIDRGAIQFHNNRMLCFSKVRELMKALNKFDEMNESDQSSSSNGDKAICEDWHIDVEVVSIGSDYFQLAWTPFNTSDIDHRKFLGYEVYYKPVDKIDPEMSIDDDRSACIDSWSSMFIQHIYTEVETDKKVSATLFAEQRIRPHTIYAYYVSTQMVHHPGAKNGVSGIGFVTTQFSIPDPPIVTVAKVEADMIELLWEPPHRPNGDIAYYLISYREIDVDLEAEAELFCANENTRAINTYSIHSTGMDDDLESVSEVTTTKAPSLTSFISAAPGTCSAISGCCACGAGGEAKNRNSVADAADEHAQFENDLLNDMFTAKCNDGSDPVGCAIESRAPEVEDLSDDLPEEDDESGESPELRIRRASEAFERQRRRFYRRVHAIRSTGGRSLQQINALILESSRKRRAIESANLASEMADKEQLTTPRSTRLGRVTLPPSSYEQNESNDPIVVQINAADIDEANEDNSTALPPVLHEEKRFASEKVVKNQTSKPGTNRLTLINLRHYTSYSIAVSACQSPNVYPTHCSPGMKAAKRTHTKPLQNIDRVNSSTIQAVFLNDSTTLHITWESIPRNKTNGGITGYMVKMIGLDGRTPPQACVAAKKGWTPEVNGTYFVGLADGQYRVSITAFSLYKFGAPAIREEPVTVFTPGFWSLERLGIASSFVICIFVVIGLIIYYYLRKFYGKKVKAMADFMQLNPEYCIENLYKQDEWEIAPDVLELGIQIGEGSFGRVLTGTGKNFTSYCGVIFGPCAVKINLDDPTAAENLNYLMEANIMKNFKTAFIVQLYGVVSTVSPAYVVMEMMELGNLRDYLRSKRDDEVFNEMDCEYYDVIPREKFHEWAAQIADGMAYLESVKFCHRDLAARNCMINKFEIVKIGDFGMARDLFYHDYYKPSGKRMMPVRWMAPESLKDGKFDSKSDTWSYGIVLYEMMTLGAQPYIGLSNDEVLNYIGMSRKVIKKPECCSEYWYKIMKMCWRFTPRERPTFAQLVHLLAPNTSVEFRDLSHVINDVTNDVTALDLDEVDIFDGPADVTPDNERRNTDSIQMREFKPSLNGMNSHSTLSMNDDSTRALIPLSKRQRSLDEDYALMTHSGRGLEQTSDTEVRNYSGDGDYVERDVQIDVPTRRNTGASNSSYGAPYCLANRGNSNERAGFGEGVRLTDGIGSGNLDDGDYVEKDLSMDTRRSTGASTNSYGAPMNWSSKSGPAYYGEKRPQNGRGDRLTHLPGTGHLQNTRGGGEYIEIKPKNGSPSRNGNGPYCQTNRGSFNGRSGFGENERLTEDTEHPLA